MAIQIIREVTADVVKRGATRAVYAKQNDVNSRFLNVRIQEDGKDIVVDPALTVMLNVERPDRKENIFYGTVNPDGSVQVPLTTWMLELVGTLVCDVSIVSEDPTVAKLTTMQFNIYVEAAVVTDENITETKEYSIIVDLLARTTDAERRATTAADNAEYLRDTCEKAAVAATDASERANEMMSSLRDNNIAIISEELAKRGQLKPEFANSIEELRASGDTSKLYVLPDGYIYAYMYRLHADEVIERITGTFVDDACVEISTNALRYLTGFVTTPYIDITKYPIGFTIKLSGIEWCDTGTSDAKGYGFHFVPVYGGTFRGGYLRNEVATDYGYEIICDASTKEVTITTTSIFKQMYKQIRFSGRGNPSGAVVEIVYTAITDTEEWTNTEHAFVPKDIILPSIKDGNWWIGEIDTGVKAQGADGQTPQRGVDYWTYDDKREIVTDAVDAVGDYLATSSYATHEYVDAQIATFDFIKVMGELPVKGLPNRFYLVPKTDTQTQDLFDEWVWVNKGTEEEPQWCWEWMTTKQIEVDLTPYATNEYVDTSALNTLKNVYPIGSIYLTMNATNPADLFGFGVWEKLPDRFLLGASDTYEVGSTGGEETHTLTIAEMPSHLHDISSTLMWANQTGKVAGGSNTYYQRSESQTTQLSGGGEPHNNMPPYLAVYMWQRTA